MDPTTVTTEKNVPANSPSANDSSGGLIRGLSLLDSVLLLAGGIIGSSIFLTAKDIAGASATPRAVFPGLGDRRRDFHVRRLRLRRTGLDVSGLGRAVHLLARSFRRPDRISLRLDAFCGRQWRHHRRALGSVRCLSGGDLPCHLRAARDPFSGWHHADPGSRGCAGVGCHRHLDQRHRTTPRRRSAECRRPGRSSSRWARS